MSQDEEKSAISPITSITSHEQVGNGNEKSSLDQLQATKSASTADPNSSPNNSDAQAANQGNGEKSSSVNHGNTPSGEGSTVRNIHLGLGIRTLPGTFHFTIKKKKKKS